MALLCYLPFEFENSLVVLTGRRVALQSVNKFAGLLYYKENTESLSRVTLSKTVDCIAFR